MEFEQIIQTMTPEIYQNMKTAVEIGKWPDGSPITDEQRDIAIQAVMIYDATHFPDRDEPFRVQGDGSVRLGKSEATKKLVDDAQNIIVKTPVKD
ncbi:YeaC family protein [Pleionea sp. CnH1-48]|uniref:YeaC family protein n=1 Tax=Pleionea sp. CnH1-48 TaxID=2954494 RepID=UPI002097B462|nr:DUF1315 family protein [Pleionea sp. CnH1-48]MCO7226004.1 YeaC family protein [Pleionea sp. CnH1-48]